MNEPAARAKSIFISYCHADNENPLGEGWIEQFHKVLKLRLEALEDEAPGIWRDKELQGNDRFADVLEQRLSDVSIVLSVLSPSYVRSEWCIREVESFAEAARRHGGLVVENKTRIFKIVKTDVDRDRHPAPLQGQIGYEFFVRDAATGKPREFTLLPGDSNTPLALNVFDDLAHAIIDTLKVIEGGAVLPASANDGGRVEEPQRGEARADEAPSACAQRAVYLAEASFDLDEQQRVVRRALEAQGFLVLPAGELPLRNPTQFRETVTDALTRCELSVHMFGAQRAPVVSGESDDIATAQNTLAATLPGRSIPRILWMPPQVEAVDDTQAQCLERLHQDAGGQQGADVLQTPVQELLTVVHDALARTPPEQSPAAGGDGRASIYVLYAAEDEAAAEGIVEHLFGLNHEVLEPLLDEGASDEQVQTIHKRKLVDCCAVLLFAANAGQFWLETQMSELKRAALWREGRPFSARGIYLGAGSSIAPRKVRSHDFVLMRQDGEFDPTQLAPFLAGLPGAGS